MRACVCVRVCVRVRARVCVCVCERERERDRQKVREKGREGERAHMYNTVVATDAKRVKLFSQNNDRITAAERPRTCAWTHNPCIRNG